MDGNHFIALDVVIESKADKGVSVNLMYASLKDGDGYKYNATIMGKDPIMGSQNDVPKGDKMRGWLTFEIPKTAKGLVFQYEPLSFTDKLVLKVDLGK